ncbi:MAG TPA: sugar ABC transporter ATP-binding protein [Solirubrobacteraceae bacterium]|nr:sugar ABC transporter ATP-binding protein [Solirubrobacteraceae bacterium]
MNANGEAPVLQAEGISKRFGSTQALREVGVRLQAGRCLGLVGRNGAGKSTLVAILSGLFAPDGGSVRFDGRPAPSTHDVRAWRERIATVYQHSMVIPALTVTENVFLGRPRTRSGRVDWTGMRRTAAQIMDEWGFDIDPTARCEELAVDQRQVVEIARALAAGTRCLLLDEPTAALERSAIGTLFERVRALTERGVAVLYISHHLEEVFEICDDITVLRDGAVVRDAVAEELTKDELVSLMVGDAAPADGFEGTDGLEGADGRQQPERPDTDARLSVNELTRGSRQGSVRGVSLRVAPGERVGVTGLLSAGVGTLGRVIAGMEPADSGEVAVDGRRIRAGDRGAALRAGIGYVPADRAAEGFVPMLSIAENETLSIARRLSSRLGVLRPEARRRAAAPLAERLSLVASGLDQPVGELSGGNQQKVVVGRALIHGPSVIVAVTPTRGVDVAAKALLLQALGEEARRAGAALVICSDELDDVMAMDRIVVLVRGQVADELTPPYDRERLIAATEGIEAHDPGNGRAGDEHDD